MHEGLRLSLRKHKRQIYVTVHYIIKITNLLKPRIWSLRISLVFQGDVF